MEMEMNHHLHFEMSRTFDFDLTPPTSPSMMIKQEPHDEELHSHVHSLLLPSSCDEVPDHDDLFSTLDFHPAMIDTVTVDDLTPPTSPLSNSRSSSVSGAMCGGSDLASFMCALSDDNTASFHHSVSPVPSATTPSLDDCLSECQSSRPSPMADYDIPSSNLNLEESIFDDFDPMIAQAAAAAAAAAASLASSKRKATDFSDFLNSAKSPLMSGKALDLSLDSKRRKLSSDVKDKRASHNVSERQRRQEMKKCFDRLRVCIPALEDNPRVHTGEVLKCAYDTIVALRDEEESMLAAIAHLRAENQRLQASLAVDAE